MKKSRHFLRMTKPNLSCHDYKVLSGVVKSLSFGASSSLLHFFTTEAQRRGDSVDDVPSERVGSVGLLQKSRSLRTFASPMLRLFMNGNLGEIFTPEARRIIQ